MSVVCWFASVFMAEMTHPRFGLVLAIGCGLLTAGSAMIFFGALILGMWPESDWAQRVMIFGGVSMACAFPAMFIALMLPL